MTSAEILKERAKAEKRLSRSIQMGFLQSALGDVQGDIDHVSRLRDVIRDPAKKRTLSNDLYILELRLEECQAAIKKHKRNRRKPK